MTSEKDPTNRRVGNLLPTQSVSRAAMYGFGARFGRGRYRCRSVAGGHLTDDVSLRPSPRGQQVAHPTRSGVGTNISGNILRGGLPRLELAHPDGRQATGTGGPGCGASAPAGAAWHLQDGMLGRDEANATEPVVPVPVLGVVVVPVRGAQVLGRIVERTAAHNPPPVFPRLPDGYSAAFRDFCQPPI